MNILIADDDKQNIAAAEIASKETEFQQHKFIFTTSASEALDKVIHRCQNNFDTDAVITDFFFLVDKDPSIYRYRDYISAFDHYVESNIENLVTGTHQRNDFFSRIMNNRFALLKGPQAGYGGVIALECSERGMPFVLVSDMSGGHAGPSSQIDGISVLSPLYVLVEDFSKSHYVNGCKKNTETWIEAIRMVLASKKGKSFEQGKLLDQEYARQNYERRRKEAELEKAEKIRRFSEIAGEIQLSDSLLAYLVNLEPEIVHIVDSNLAVAKKPRSEYGGSGGCGYYDQLHVYFRGQTIMKEFMWRDRYSAANDRPYLSINSIDNVGIQENEDIVNIIVTVSNGYGSRNVSFELENKPVSMSVLTAEQLDEFESRVNQQIDKILIDREPGELRLMVETTVNHNNRRNKKTPSIFDEAAYKTSSLKQKVINPVCGVAAFVTEEQIGHQGDDRQMMFSLYVMKDGMEEADLLLRDSAYQRREKRSGLIAISNLMPDAVSVSTDSGPMTIKF